MLATSTIRYTFEDRNGNAETFITLDDAFITQDEIIGEIELQIEDEKRIFPLIKGYKKPYDWNVTDEIGTEHYIYYEEGMIQMPLTVYELRIFESDDVQTSVDTLQFYDYDQLNDVLEFLLNNNERNEWEFETVEIVNGKEKDLMYYDYETSYLTTNNKYGVIVYTRPGEKEQRIDRSDFEEFFQSLPKHMNEFDQLEEFRKYLDTAY